MFKGIIIIIAILFILIAYVRGFSYKNGITTGQYILYFANIGTGKSCILARIAQTELKLIKKGKSAFTNVVSNAMIKGVDYIPDLRSALKQGSLINCLILCEEAGITYSNKSKDELTAQEREIKKLMRHYLCSWCLVSQSISDISIIVRRLYTEIWLLRVWGNVTACKRIVKEIDISDDHQIDDKYYFSNWILTNKYIYKPFYYHLFDSYYRPDYIPIINIEENKVVHSNGKITLLQNSSAFRKMPSASDMTKKEIILSNRNIKNIYDSVIVIKKSIKELIKPKYKNKTIKSINKELDNLTLFNSETIKVAPTVAELYYDFCNETDPKLAKEKELIYMTEWKKKSDFEYNEDEDIKMQIEAHVEEGEYEESEFIK